MDGSQSFLEVQLSGKTYGIPIELVKEINSVGEITPVPNNPPYVCGLVNLRGQVLSVIDLNVRLGQPKARLTRESCIVVVQIERAEFVGLLVDAVFKVNHLEADRILPPPPECHLSDSSVVSGIGRQGDEMITLLDIQRCLHLVPISPTEQPSGGEIRMAAVKLLS